MDLIVFENNKPFVIDEFRQGRFDYVELASDVAETKFFQFLFSEDVVNKLAAHYPSPRKRHHVPMWMYLSSQVSLRLHGMHSYHSYPWVIRSGGLIDALGPEVAQRHVEPETGNLHIECQGFNDRNLFPRQTPCDQDYLRKLARDTEAEKLEEWYNCHVANLYAELKAYDEEGIFLADGSYLFVPDNEHYEGSARLLFDEHNHPVSKKQEQEMTKAQRDRCRWRRCYKAVFLLHCDAAGERFVVVGLRVLTGVLSNDIYADGHEESWLLVSTANWSARRIRDRYALRTDIEERHRQVKCFWDLTRFHSTALNLVVSQTVFVCLTYSLLQIHLRHQGHQELNRRTWPTTRRLLPDGDRVIVYCQQHFAFFTLLEHMELTLSLEGKAHRRALAKTRRLQQQVPGLHADRPATP